MKAIILAAGQGTRIRSVNGEHPKCLITFNNTDWTILDQQIMPSRTPESGRLESPSGTKGTRSYGM